MASRAPSKKIAKISPPDSKPSQAKLILALLFAAGAIGVLIFRTHSTLQNAKPALLHLSDDVILGDAPPLPGDDLNTFREKMTQCSALQVEARSKPADVQAWAKAGQAAMVLGDYLSASTDFQRLIQLNTSASSDIYDALGQSQAQLGQRSKALLTYQTLLKRFPHSAEGYIGLSRAQSSFGNKIESLKTLDDASHVMQTIPDRIHIAHEFEQKGDLARALQESQSVLTSSPDDPLAMLMTGHLLFMLVRLPEAQQIYSKLTLAHPEDGKARYTYAEILDNPMTKGRDRQMAENILLDMIQQDPRDPKPYAKLGAMYFEQGHFKQSAYIYIRLLELVPDSAAARLQLAQAYAKLGDLKSSQSQQEIAQRLLMRDREEAQLQADIARQPADAVARLKLALHYQNYGQFGNSLPPLQAAFSIDSGNKAIQSSIQKTYADLHVPLLQ